MCLCKLPLELFSHFLLFCSFLHHLGGRIIPFVPSLLLRDDGIEFFLLFLYILAAHIELLLLLHTVVAHPELDAKAQERRHGIMLDNTQLVAVMHYRVYGILKFVFSSLNPITFIFSSLCCCLGSIDIFSNRFFYR
jgi:hypothetical protein